MHEFEDLTDAAQPPVTSPLQFPSGDAREGLQKLRTRLLDLTTRNRLLHLRVTRETLRIVDTSLEHIGQALLAGESLPFLPVPMPEDDAAGDDEDLWDVRGAATRAGWNLSYELATEPGHSRCLPVLQTAGRLDAQLRRIASAARTAMEESGFNMLFLALGVLEWREIEAPDEPRLAPLVLIPVTLERTASGPLQEASWSLAYSGEDMGSNLSLVEKLRGDFGIEPPLLEPLVENENGAFSAEAYLAQWQPILEARGWKIRRQMALSLFSFGKLLMFHDLNPENWPAEAPLAEHPRVRELFEGVRSSDANYASEYPIDRPEYAETLPPLIFEADSSQHSALIDAVNKGRNLVIEGPPGTGKSQTITNLIAAALMMGKTVLFVAEKMAALDIVRERLDQAGLSPFCLELHSHATRRQAFLLDIKRRLELPPQPDIEDVTEHLTQQASQRETLNHYVRLLHTPQFGMFRSPYQILWARDTAIEALGGHVGELERARVPEIENWTRAEFERHENEAEAYGQRLANLMERWSDLLDHPWAVVDNANLGFDEEEALLQRVIRLRDAAAAIDQRLRTLAHLTGVPRESLPETAEAMRQMVAALPPVLPDIPFELLDALRDPAGEMALSRLVSVMKQHRQLRRALTRSLVWPEGLTSELQQECTAALRALESSEANDLTQMLPKELEPLATFGRDFQTKLQFGQKLYEAAGSLLGFAGPFAPQRAADLLAALRLVESAPIDALPYRHPGLDEEDAVTHLEAALAAAIELRQLRTQLSQRFNLQNKIDPRQLRLYADRLQSASFLSLRLDKEARDAKQVWHDLTGQATPSRPAEMAADLRSLSDFLYRLDEFQQQSAWRQAAGPHYRTQPSGIDTPWDALLHLARWYRQIEGALPGYQRGAAELRHQLLSASPDLLRDLLRLLQESPAQTAALAETVEAFTALGQAIPATTEWLRTLPLPAALARLQEAGEAARRLLAAYESTGINASIAPAELPEVFRQAESLRRIAASVEADPLMPQLLGSLWQGIETELPPLQAALDFVSTLRTAYQLPPQMLQWLLHPEFESRLTALREALNSTAEASEGIPELLQEVERLAGPSARHRLDPPDPISTAELLRRTTVMVNDPGALAEWLQYLRSRQNLIEAGVGMVPDAIEQGWLRPEQAAAALRFVVYQSLTRLVMNTQAELHRFDGLQQEAARRRFDQLDEMMIHDVTRRHIISTLSHQPIPEGRGTGPVRLWSDLCLLRHEVRKQKQNLPIRQVISRAGRALQALKPCFLMSPLSAAQYLPPGAIRFDLVIMDEASQLTPEDAIGAIARGQQLVIVGDSKQLPPTSFFQRQAIEDAEASADATVAEEAESILDVALSLYQPARRLRWHYRSRHHSLITFSNETFYDDHLIVAPSPQGPDDSLGVSYVEVDGFVEDQRNLPEAEAVVAAVMEHIHRYPDKSLGVLTINFQQRQLLEELLDKAIEQDLDARRWRRRMEAERREFFVKNLENAQGDERDTIFISITYGPDRNGQLHQRFGLTAASGHRRLNVLFTRARDRVKIFSSLNPDRIRVEHDTNFGVRVLKDYLTNARDGTIWRDSLSHTRAANDFERSVGAVLQRHGFQAAYRLGFARSVIDVAVRHPDHPQRYVLGIESDGYTYQSAVSARDRDRLREMHLRALGWNLHRIWTTDWFRRRRHEEQRLIEAVNRALDKASAAAGA